MSLTSDNDIYVETKVTCHAATSNPKCVLEISAPGEATLLKEYAQSDEYKFLYHGHKSKKVADFRVPVGLYGNEFICRAKCREVNITVQNTTNIVFECKRIAKFLNYQYKG